MTIIDIKMFISKSHHTWRKQNLKLLVFRIQSPHQVYPPWIQVYGRRRGWVQEIFKGRELLVWPKTKAVSVKEEDRTGLPIVETAHGEGYNHSWNGQRVNGEDHSGYFQECTDATKSPISFWKGPHIIRDKRGADRNLENLSEQLASPLQILLKALLQQWNKRCCM